MAFTRVRFFDGQMLSAEDFETEQAYHMEKRRLHNRLLHVPGVVKGLDVSLDGPSIVVSPGFALDRLGNEILVELPLQAAIEGCTSKECFVTIRYTETPSDPVPALDGSAFRRIVEGCTVEVSESPAEQAIVLARLVRIDSAWEVIADTGRL
jgi:hypothetical protein